ncbi:MAG: c-type cytochrome [Candidatus Nitrospinota bacterium M3_3B_026]
MMRAMSVFFISLALLAGPALAGGAPKAFKKCKTCHGPLGKNKGKIGPDLATTKYTFEQFTNQVKNGSKWDGKPAKREGFEKKKMPPQKKLSDEDIKTLYDYVQSAK